MEQQTGPKLGKKNKSVYWHPAYLIYIAEWLTWSQAGWDEAQTGIKITGRTINNLKFAKDTTLMEESKDKLKSLLMKVKEESEKADFFTQN